MLAAAQEADEFFVMGDDNQLEVTLRAARGYDAGGPVGQGMEKTSKEIVRTK